MSEPEEKELKLLRNLHFDARGVMRYNGVDLERTEQYYNQLSSSVHELNDFYNSEEWDEI